MSGRSRPMRRRFLVTAVLVALVVCAVDVTDGLHLSVLGRQREARFILDELKRRGLI